jgi:hypothetical protein
MHFLTMFNIEWCVLRITNISCFVLLQEYLECINCAIHCLLSFIINFSCLRISIHVVLLFK